MQLDATTHDISTQDGRIARAYDSDSILQTVKTRLLTIRQEFFLDLDAGLPWFVEGEMTGKNVDLYRVKSYVSNEIVGTDGVSELLSIELIIDKPARKLDIIFSYIDIHGTTQNETL